MLPRRPETLQYLHAPIGASLARLSGLEGLARSSVVGILPLIAFDALGSKQAVSVAYFSGAAIAMVVTLNLGTLERRLTRRWTLTGGLCCLIAGAAVFATVSGPAFALGIAFHAIAASTFSVGLSLYIMDFIGRGDLTRNESRRMVYSGAAWFIGPSLGAQLYRSGHHTLPFVLTGCLAIIVIAYFWVLRLRPNDALPVARSQATNPLRTIPRFFGQRHLRIAYVITLVRSMFWVTLFIYGPIYVVEAGLSARAAGFMLSAVAALLFGAPVIQRVSFRFGVPRIIIAGFGLIAAGMTGLAAIGEPQPIGIAFWVLAACGGATIDVLGNVPFMRLVKRRERVAMTTVFTTWREVSSFLAPALAALVLLVAPFWVFFLCLAGLACGAAIAASYLPRRLT